MTCAKCHQPGAGLRYQHLYRALWFHPKCWQIARLVDGRFQAKVSAAALTEEANTGKVEEIGLAERATAQPTLEQDQDAGGHLGMSDRNSTTRR